MKYLNNVVIFCSIFLLIISCKTEEKTAVVEEVVNRNYLYFDATANYKRFSYQDSIIYYLDKVKDVGVTDIVVDVKPITGEVLYPSKIAPVMTEWHGEYQAGTRDNSWDMLTLFIEEGHKRGLRVHASTNVFVGGHNFFDRGIVYDDPTKQDWQTLSYLEEGMVPITEQKKKYSAMLNPALKEVQEYQLSILKELVGMYPNLDGLILDRVRYDGIQADFSEKSRALFEEYIGEEVKEFPNDIFSYTDESPKKRTEGKWYKKWLEWRAFVIHDFIVKAKEEVKAVNDNIIFGDYTGSWYPTYYEVGVNFASKEYDPSQDFDWATADYKNTGYAETLDVFLTGNYFYEVEKKEIEEVDTTKVNRSEAGQSLAKEDWYTVEGSADLVNKIVKNKTSVYAGLYVEQYKNDPEQFIKALKMCRSKSEGAMIFDIVHIINYGWWNELKQGLSE